MHISKIVIENYKSFHRSEEVSLQPGINIVIGSNNSGKTALLEALCGRFKNKPHKNESFSFKQISKVEQTQSISTLSICVSASELITYLIETENILNPMLPSPTSERPDQVVSAFNNALKTGLKLDLRINEGRPMYDEIGFNLYSQLPHTSPIPFIQLCRANTEAIKFEAVGYISPVIDILIGYRLLAPFISQIYRFNPERLIVSSSHVGANNRLSEDIANLPEVLQVLSTKNPARFKRFAECINRIFPSVKWVSATTNDNNKIEIKIWPVAHTSERDNLAVLLSECGTGIGQALAILYVVISSEEPRVIIIDEPQSFLHPGAIRTLIEILKEFPQHQYIITTHSPEILATANPSTITSLRLENGETKSKSLMLDQTQELREVFDDVGVRFGDLFFADDILWVEGPTEQKAFPQIIEKLIPEAKSRRVTILPLIATGDLQSKKQRKKNAEKIFEIYNKLSGAHALVPPMVGIILDQEELSDGEKKTLRTLGGERVSFIPSMMIENYLLDAEAIAVVANQQEGFRDVPITSEELIAWLEKEVSTGKYSNNLLKTTPNFNDPKTIKKIHGAKLLEELFKHFSKKCVEYRKTTHSVQLVAWLLKNKPEQLKDIADTLRKILIEKNFSDSEQLQETD